MAFIYDVISKFLCPICVIPHEKLFKAVLSGLFEWHTRDKMTEILWTAWKQQCTNEKEVILMGHGLHDVDVSHLPLLFPCYLNNWICLLIELIQYHCVHRPLHNAVF